MEGGGKAEAEQKAKAARKRLEGILSAKQRDNSENGNDDDSEFPWGKERPRLQDLQLSTYEQTIAMEVVAPEDISVKFDG